MANSYFLRIRYRLCSKRFWEDIVGYTKNIYKIYRIYKDYTCFPIHSTQQYGPLCSPRPIPTTQIGVGDTIINIYCIYTQFYAI